MQTTEALPKLTRSELALAQKVGLFLAPMFRDVLDRHRKTVDNGTAQFCASFAATMAARDALPASAPAMARVELDLRLLELAQDFVRKNTKA
jgi:hypothetical protein